MRRALFRDRRGVALPEFAFLLVPFCLLLMGGMDVGYQAYVRSVAVGALETLARHITLQNADPAVAEAELRTTIQQVSPRSTIAVSRGSVSRFASLDAMERLTVDLNGNGQLDGPVDTDGNGIPDRSDCWEDVDNNMARNTVVAGRDGIGGADDLVRYKVTVSYERILPVWNFIGVLGRATISTSTVLRRQPYETQGTPPVRCA